MVPVKKAMTGIRLSKGNIYEVVLDSGSTTIPRV
jgi:hypothetical protein